MTRSAHVEKANVGRQWLNAFRLDDKWTAPLDMIYPGPGRTAFRLAGA